MIFFKAILLGAIQGLSEFFPVSSTGHVSLVGELMGLKVDVAFLTMLHLGTFAAAVLYFRNDIKRIFAALGNIIADVLYNFKVMFVYSARPEERSYKKLISTNYRRFSIFILAALVPTFFIGAVISNIAGLIISNMLCVSMGFFVTALILLVASFTNWNVKGPKEARLVDSLLIGTFQGMSVFPGVSSLAMTYSAGLYRGFSKKFARLFSFMLLIPTVMGAALFEGICVRGTLQIDAASAICAMIVSFVVGYYVIGKAVKLVSKISVKAFSIYCFVIGVISVFVYLS